MRNMPEHFRYEISCKGCPASLEADGHFSMAAMDVWLASHIQSFEHMEYDLKIIMDKPVMARTKI